MYEGDASNFALFPGNCIVPGDGCPVHPKHVAALVIKSWLTKNYVELVSTDWRQCSI
jgi:hypothetical protein